MWGEGGGSGQKRKEREEGEGGREKEKVTFLPTYFINYLEMQTSLR